MLSNSATSKNSCLKDHHALKDLLIKEIISTRLDQLYKTLNGRMALTVPNPPHCKLLVLYTRISAVLLNFVI